MVCRLNKRLFTSVYSIISAHSEDGKPEYQKYCKLKITSNSFLDVVLSLLLFICLLKLLIVVYTGSSKQLQPPPPPKQINKSNHI